MFASHRAGHWWGDDWALYLRQANGLLDGDPGRVIDENRFTVEMSSGPAFSPPLYPWGFPLILAPFVAVFGTDLDRLTIVPVLCACVFACAWYLLAKPRIGTVPALVGVGAVSLSPLLLGWSELIQSEWPFLAVTAVVLVGLDRAARSGRADSHRRHDAAPGGARDRCCRGILGPPRGSRHGGRDRCRPARRPDRRTRPALVARPLDGGRPDGAAAAPPLAALLMVGLLQFLLPSTLVPQYSGTSFANVWRFADDHVDHLAEVAGLKRSWEANPTIFDNVVLGWIAVACFLLLAAIGIALALTRNRRARSASRGVRPGGVHDREQLPGADQPLRVHRRPPAGAARRGRPAHDRSQSSPAGAADGARDVGVVCDRGRQPRQCQRADRSSVGLRRRGTDRVGTDRSRCDRDVRSGDPIHRRRRHRRRSEGAGDDARDRTAVGAGRCVSPLADGGRAGADRDRGGRRSDRGPARISRTGSMSCGATRASCCFSRAVPPARRRTAPGPRRPPRRRA